MIDPGIWDSEQVMQLSPAGFKLYVYLISQADDEGRLSVSYSMMASRVFPLGGASPEDVPCLVKEMDRTGLVILYVVDGKEYIEHPNWTTYQKIDRPSPSHFPIRRTIDDDSSKARANRIEEKGKEVKGNRAASAAIEKTDPLYHRIEQGFLKHNGNKFTDYGKEGKAIHGLIAKARARDAEHAEGLLASVCTQFWKLKSGTDKFWTGQPFLPSALNSSSIWDRVLESMRDEKVDPELLAIIRGEKA
jgi:hypothetical protein